MYKIVEYQHGIPLRDKLEAPTWRDLMRKLQCSGWWAFGCHRIERKGEDIGPAALLESIVESRRCERGPYSRIRTDLPSITLTDYREWVDRYGDESPLW